MKGLGKLKSSFLVKSEVIEKVNKYIKNKHPHNSEMANKEILADTLNRILNKNLAELGNMKQEIIEEVVIEAVEKQSEGITKYDVLEACTEKMDKKPEMKDKLRAWSKSNLNQNIEEDDFEEYLEEIKGLKYVRNENASNTVHKASLVAVGQGVGEGVLGLPQVTVKGKDVIDHVISALRRYFTPKVLFKNAKTIMIFIMSLMFILSFKIDEVINEQVEVKNQQKVEEQQKVVLVSMYDEYRLVRNEKLVKYDELAVHPHLPTEFNYVDVNEVKLKEYLNGRKSLLAEEPYFSEIIETAEEFNINPLVILAIAGQEQGFVPKDSEHASSIVNNPYNVFHSWQDYNTNIEDTTKIVCRTIINLGKGLPENTDAFKWINKMYASDQNWYKGVRELFNKLLNIASDN